jgi:hypothetical protein
VKRGSVVGGMEVIVQVMVLRVGIMAAGGFGGVCNVRQDSRSDMLYVVYVWGRSGWRRGEVCIDNTVDSLRTTVTWWNSIAT